MIDAYEIRTLNKAPSMCESKIEFSGTYEDAVNAAKMSFAITGRTTSVVKDAYYWFKINADGTCVDKNATH